MNTRIPWIPPLNPFNEYLYNESKCYVSPAMLFDGLVLFRQNGKNTVYNELSVSFSSHFQECWRKKKRDCKKNPIHFTLKSGDSSISFDIISDMTRLHIFQLTEATAARTYSYIHYIIRQINMKKIQVIWSVF